MSHLPYDTFREMLVTKYPNCGHALWEPSPGGMYDSVKVGDVGFIRQGCFHRLFNVLLPGNHPSHQNFGVPEHHQQLRLNAPNHIHRGVEGTDDFCSRHVSLSRGRDIVHALGPDDDHQVTVSCPGRRGAMLSLPFPAQREDTVALGDFGRWIVKHIDRWFAFAENLGLGINRMQDIVLVTGRHCAKSWVNVAFSEGQRDAEVSFEAHPSGASGMNIERRSVRGDVVLKLGPSGENLPENQCIFIRGFRVVRILKIWPRLRGRAGPAPDVDGYEPEPEPDKQLEVIGIPADTNYQDPLHVLLEYIAERAPDCDMVLAHDDDLACIDDVKPLDSLQPDALIKHFRDSAPEIQQVQWGDESSKSATEVTITKIATLSKGAFTIGKSMAVNDESPIRIGDIRAPSPPTVSKLPKLTEPSTFKGVIRRLTDIAKRDRGHKRSSSTPPFTSEPVVLPRLLGDGDDDPEVDDPSPDFIKPTTPLPAHSQPPTTSGGPEKPQPTTFSGPSHPTSHKQLPGAASSSRSTLGTSGLATGTEKVEHSSNPVAPFGTFATVSADLPRSTQSAGGSSITLPPEPPPKPSVSNRSHTAPVVASIAVAPQLSLSASLPMPDHKPVSTEVLATMEKVASDAECLLRLAEDGTVSAGNLEGLVSRVIDTNTDSPGGEHFRATFLTIYQLFSTNARLFEILKRRFESANLDPTDTRSQHSILLFIESWLKRGFEDEDLSFSSEIREFALAILESGSQELKAKAAEILSMIYNPDYVYLRQPRSIVWLRRKPARQPPKARPIDLAAALTVVAGNWFRRITYWDYVNFTRQRPNVRRMELLKSLHDKIVEWVQRSVMEPRYLEERAKMFESWIYTAQECRSMNNFSSASAIVNALVSPKVAMLVLACESRATQIIHTLNRDLAPMTGAYFDTLRHAGTKELIPWLDPHLSILNTTFAHSHPIVEVDGHHLIDFKLCGELAEQIDSITEYSPPPVSAEIREDVLEYVEYNLLRSLAVKASSPVVRSATRLARKERSTLTKRETMKSLGELRAPLKGRMDTTPRRHEGPVAPRRGGVGRRRGGMARRHEEDTSRRREEKMVRQREEMVRRREEMTRQREEKMTRRREEKMVRQREEMARRGEEDMARWRKDVGRWRKDMARWRKDTTRWRREDSAWRGGEDLEGVPDEEDTSVEPRRKGLKSRLLSFLTQKL